MIGIHHAKLRKLALAICEKLGIFRDYPCSKSCISQFASIAINELVKRQGCVPPDLGEKVIEL